MGAGLESLEKRSPWRLSDDDFFRRVMRIPKESRILVVSPENLDRRPWEALGHLLSNSEIPRLTFWPEQLDPKGYRFPYWWNYVNWPQIPRPGFARRTRLGILYDPDRLTSPSPLTPDWHSRLHKAVLLSQHHDFPRPQVLNHLSMQIDVDVLSNVPHGHKIDVLRKYKYCVVTENSTGYGYETEKTPDAVVAGCVPIGFVANPWSDFDSDAVFFDVPQDLPPELPALLPSAPELRGLLEYLGRILN